VFYLTVLTVLGMQNTNIPMGDFQGFPCTLCYADFVALNAQMMPIEQTETVVVSCVTYVHSSCNF